MADVSFRPFLSLLFFLLKNLRKVTFIRIQQRTRKLGSLYKRQKRQRASNKDLGNLHPNIDPFTKLMLQEHLHDLISKCDVTPNVEGIPTILIDVPRALLKRARRLQAEGITGPSAPLRTLSAVFISYFYDNKIRGFCYSLVNYFCSHIPQCVFLQKF